MEKDKIKDLEDFIRFLRDEDKPIIVEGKNDKIALIKIGCTMIITLSKNPLYKVVEDVVKKERGCIILTDLDKKGKELYGKLNRQLQQFGVRVDDSYRDFLFKKTKLRQIEGLYRYCLRNGVEL
ncbi:toprim domain-containing protein [Nanoarchaeota archaeon]